MSRLYERLHNVRLGLGDRFWQVADWIKALPGAAKDVPQGAGFIEGQVHEAFEPVRPSAGFRDNLRDNLTLAAEKRASGLAIESAPAYREGIVLGTLLGIVAVAAAITLVVAHTHLKGSGR